MHTEAILRLRKMQADLEDIRSDVRKIQFDNQFSANLDEMFTVVRYSCTILERQLETLEELLATM